LELRRRHRHGIKVGRIRRLFIRGWVLRRRWHGARIIRTLRMSEDARGSIATGREVPAWDEPGDLWRRKIREIAAS